MMTAQFVIFIKLAYDQIDRIRKCRLHRACSVHGKDKILIQFCLEDFEKMRKFG